MSLRIGFDVTPLNVPRSGVGTYTACLLEQLQQGNDTIVPLSNLPAQYRWSTEGNGRPRVLNKTLWMQLQLPRQLQRAHIDLCHFTNNVAPISTPCPSILTIHDMTLWLYPAYHPIRRLVTMRPILPIAARRAAAIITVSQQAKNDIIRILGISPNKIHVIHEAPGDEFRPLTGDQELAAARRQYQLPERFILHVGTLEPRKNLVRLLEAFAYLHHTKALPHELVFVGKRGWKYGQIFATAEALGLDQVVHFLDFVPNRWLPTIYNLADLLVFPSLYEGFGLPLLEAMACGTPVVSSPSGALQEVAGEAAVFIEPTAVDSIADGIYQVLIDDQRRAALRAGGLAWAGRFSWDRTARLTRQLYWQVATGVPTLQESRLPATRSHQRPTRVR